MTNRPADLAGRCPYCGNLHQTKCFMVKAFEYHPDGSLRRVEFFEPLPAKVESGPSIVVGSPWGSSVTTWAVGDKHV